MVARKCQHKNKLQHNNFFYDTTLFLTATYNLYNNLKTSRQNTILFHNNIKSTAQQLLGQHNTFSHNNFSHNNLQFIQQLTKITTQYNIILQQYIKSTTQFTQHFSHNTTFSTSQLDIFFIYFLLLFYVIYVCVT